MATITDSWSDIKTSIIHGTFSYAIGDTKQFTYKTSAFSPEYTVDAEVRYIDTTKKIVDFVIKDFASTISSSISNSTCMNIYNNGLPSDLKEVITPCKKIYFTDTTNTATFETAYLWLLNSAEVGGTGSYGRELDNYSSQIIQYFSDNESRKKRNLGTGNYEDWWTGTHAENSSTKCIYVTASGSVYQDDYRYTQHGLVFGFRIGMPGNTRDLLGDQETLDALIAHELTEFVENDVTSVRSYAFYKQETIESIILPNLTTGVNNVFSGCLNLKKAYFPNLVSIGSYTFYDNSELEEVELPNLTTIGGSNFSSCPKLLRIIIGTNNNNNIVNLSSSSSLQLSYIARAIIYVNDNLVESYRADTKWEHLASRIYGISDLYKYEWTDSEIEDDWETICTKIDNGQAQYKIGQYKSVDLGAEGIIKFRISAVNADEKSDSSGTAKYTWISENALATQRRYNDSGSVQVNWGTSEIRSVLAETIFPLFPNVLKNNIKEVKKYTSIRDSSGTQDSSYLTNDKIWLLSSREVSLNPYYARETNGPKYDMAFTTDDNSRKRSQITTPQSYDRWWTRSDAYSATYPTGVTSNGAVSSGNMFGQQTRACNIVIGFCT